MIREFAVRPVPKNKNARTLFFVLLGGAAVGMIVSYFMNSYKGIVQLLALILLVAAVTVYTRYIGSVYSYEVSFDSDGTPIFVVCQLSGRRRTSLCRVDLADVLSIDALTAEQYRAYKTEQGVKRYNYTPTLYPPEVHILKVRGRHERADVLLEISAECREALLAYAAEAREMRAMSGEE